MMNKKNSKLALMLVASAVSVALTGCGSDGDDGKDGIPGLPGGEPAEAIQQLKLEVLSVTYEGDNPTLKVFATNEDDEAVVGLSAFEVKKAVQLVPAGATGAGNSAEWQLIGSQNEFTDNKNGTYSFTIETEGFNPELTQRYNLIVSAGTLLDGTTTVPRTEFTQDFDGEGYDAKYTKNVVSTEACQACHAEGESIYHSYTSLDTCTSCHTDELARTNGVQTGFNHLIHNVHNNNKMYGRNMDKSAETANNIVQDNCQNCHVESEELPEWGNWTRIPTMETCSSCHTGIDFEAGQGHPQQSDNSNCIACHNASWTEEIHTSGLAEKKAFIDMYGMNSTLTVNEDNSATLSVSITDASGEAIDVTSLVSQIQQLETITNVGPNFPVMGYNPNPGTGLEHVVEDLVSIGELEDGVTIVDGNLEYTIPSLPFGVDSPAGIQDTYTAFSFIGLNMCNDGTSTVACDSEDVMTTVMKADMTFGTFPGEVESMRHINSVSFSTCENCHGETFEIHNGNGHPGFIMTEQLGREIDGEIVVGIDGCVTCHTPDGTYLSGGNQGALEMKLHSVHGKQGIIKDCTQCHNDFNLDAFKLKGALATEVVDPYTPSQVSLYTTPITATCASCHGFEEIKLHAEGQGGVVNGSYEDANASAQLEFCMGCHAPTIFDHTAMKM
ncbi:OmcA/MtrC family decaheme c-type cytochrome [Shewanella sp. 5_MG-2023]|uniref:OmcA/MtrC family decaheme c-type cytochrome n=1 Tax=Shewanella sp. 5_MG-2023 TaxID=3062656 RepID=UPI0026E145C3|nr:OmcA/MtrC family decaheme c-type cytochrome [Shewanella sp. 5_MG-2023]MDO6639328.1 OmcA/MtrC family decaheme c-type cytochrome [Shewanella sp. 5_MG-2023]